MGPTIAPSTCCITLYGSTFLIHRYHLALKNRTGSPHVRDHEKIHLLHAQSKKKHRDRRQTKQLTP